MAAYTLFGAKISLYTGKIRSYLVYKGIDFEEITASLKVYKNVIVPNTGVRFIPVVKTPAGQYIQDSAVIIDTLELVHLQRPVFPAKAKQLLVSKLFEIFADEWLLIPAMHYRWNKGQDDYVYAEFGKTIFPGLPGFMQRFLGRRAGARFKGFVAMLGIDENTITAVEQWYEGDFLPALDTHFGAHDYLLGGVASIGDLALMGPLYAHLYQDPESGKIINTIAPNVAKWIERMNTPPEQLGSWLENDEIPETLVPILTRIFAELFPVLQSTVGLLETWRQQNSATDIPRFIAKHGFRIGDARGERVVTPFSQWKLQRLLDVYHGFDANEKAAVDAFLCTINGLTAMQTVISDRIDRKDNRLVWSS